MIYLKTVFEKMLVCIAWVEIGELLVKTSLECNAYNIVTIS